MQTTTSHRADPLTVSTPGMQARESWVLPLLVAAIGVVHLFTLRHGHSWHDDFALYVMHARNLVEGRPYGETGYLYNPVDPMHSPQVYPPGFPLLLAPIYAVFGPDLYLLRMVVVASFLGAMALFAALIRPLLPPRHVLAAVALVGFQPFLLRFKNQLLPDMSFLLFAFAALLLLRRLQEAEPERQSIGIALMAGLCVAASVSMRMVGVALFAAVPLYYLLRWKLPRRGIVVAGVTALALLGLQALAMPASSGYAAQMTDLEEAGWSPGPQRPFRTFVELLSLFRAAWSPRGELWAYQLTPSDQGLAVAATVLTFMLAAIGFTARLRRVTILETFVVAYTLVLLNWGFIAGRYIIPLIPFLLLYAVLGACWLQKRGRPARAAVLAVSVAAAGFYAVNISRVQLGPYYPDVASAESEELFSWIRECTADDAVLAALRPRAMALFTGRQAMTFGGDLHDDPEAVVRRLEAQGVDYFVTFSGGSWDSVFARGPTPAPVWSNSVFNVRLADGAGDTCAR